MAKKCTERIFSKKYDFVENEIINKPTFPEEQKQEFLRKFSHFKSEIKARWVAANRTEHVFLKKNRDWLRITMEIPENVTGKPGRPSKPFVQLSERSKRRKTRDLRDTNEADELIYASQMKLREAGSHKAAKVVKDITTTPTRGTKYLRGYKRSITIPSKPQLTPTHALSIFVEASLTRRQYEIIRTSDKKLYPCYSVLQREKKYCYPIQEAYRVTATYAEVKLQDLLNHTSQRLLLYLDDVLQTLTTDETASLELIYKWGCDGSQQTEYKQKFENSNESDANIFQSSLVPLQLICRSNKRVIWKNPTSSSPRYCRPMRIRFIHETSDVTDEEIQYYNNQIRSLDETKVLRATGEISIKHTMLFTMVDGKVCNAATQTKSTMRCYICKATSKDFNNLKALKEVNYENLKFGLSVLHARIRFFKTLLHLSYKITVQKWQIRSQTEKDTVKERKKKFKINLRLGLASLLMFRKLAMVAVMTETLAEDFLKNRKYLQKSSGLILD
ncbi:unnamed protein product [Euphydryas editha]|uniref:Reverse transcriptase domain-containing protein n=1 Tax=Euphydryas editha TaxID=104508 RepID=A0AAU9V6I8_EUPED|nr:unnamed protein product [Euphydryas editha]